MRIFLTLTLSAALLVLAGCKKEQPKAAIKEAPAVTVRTTAVTEEQFLAATQVTGSLVSNSRVDVKAETLGRVVRFDKEEGAAVAAGEAVVWLNDENARLSLREAETALKVAEASVERIKVSAAHSASELERAENLVKSGGITDKDLKTARLADQDSRAQLGVSMAQVEQSRAAVEVARKRLRDAVIYAPVAGVIQRKFVNKGAYVEGNNSLFSLVDNSKLELESPVPASELGAIQSGQRVSFTVNTFPGARFEGKVVEVSPAVDAETRSAKVRIQAPGDGKLKSGMFAQGEIHTGAVARAIVIPAAAAYRDDRTAKTSYVFVVENGKAARRAVKLGRERESKLEVLEGLKPGDTLILDQSIEVAEGVRVQARS